MFAYKKYLEYPIANIKKKDLRFAKYLITTVGGAAGELSSAVRYMQQRYTMPDDKGRALLTDIATEELAHIEIVSSLTISVSSVGTSSTIATSSTFSTSLLLGRFGNVGTIPIPVIL